MACVGTQMDRAGTAVPQSRNNFLPGRTTGGKSSLSCSKNNERIKESAEICRGSTSTPQCSSLGPLLENDYPAGLRTFKSHKANNNR